MDLDDNGLSETELRERAAVMAAGGRMAATMRAAECMAWPRGMLNEVWRWVCWLMMVRGYRGATTSANYVRAVMLWGKWLVENGQSWTDARLEGFEAWLKHLYLARGHGKSHRSVACSAVKSFYRWRSARNRGRDCTHGLVAPKVERHVPRKHAPAELRAIFAALSSARHERMRARDRALLLLLLTTGARREEVSSLRMRDIAFDGRIAVVRIFGKGAKEREVAIEGPVIQALLEWIELRRKISTAHDALFVGFHSAGEGVALAPGGVERCVQRYCRRAGVRHSGVHVFRVTFASQLYDDGVDLERIRIVMGHESIETTRKYLAVSNRQRSVRLKPHRQHAALGTSPIGLPRWAAAMEGSADD